MYEKSLDLGNPSTRSIGRRCAAALCLVVCTVAPALAAAAEPAAANDQIWKFTARFHAVVLHLPIGLMGFVYLLEVYALFRSSTEVRRIITLALVCTSLSAVAVAALGLLLAQEGGYHGRTLSLHKWLGIAFVALILTATVLQIRAYRRRAVPSSKTSYRGFLAATAVLLTFAGHYGGNLTHGSQYLTKYAPDFVKKLVAEDSASTENGADATESGSYFAENIRPILAAKCFRCHGPEKQKGDYRADLKEALFAAGESEEPAIVPGEPMESYLIRLILLPGEHEDVMPPKGKAPLTSDEILRLVHWVQDGATMFQGNELAHGDAPATTTEDDAESAAPSAHEAEVADLQPTEMPTGPVDFATHIAPILEANCISCHGKKKRRGRLALHDLKSTLKGGKEHGPAVVPGDPDKSPLLTLVKIGPEDDDSDLMMPPDGDGEPLTANQIELIRRWLADGAKWPEGVTLKKPDDSEKLATRS